LTRIYMTTEQELSTRTPPQQGRIYNTLVALLLIAGIAPRLSYYLTGRALWFDEAALCINILERSFGGLLEPLVFKQVAPPLYLWTLKLCTLLAGPTVYAVRLSSVLAGLAVIFLFWAVARRILSPSGALVALFMAVLSQHLINYAGEAKPYASDVALTLAVIWMALRWEDKAPSWQRALRYGAIQAVMVWYSFPVVFVIAGVGLSQLALATWRRAWFSVGCLALLYGLGAASFLVEYIVAIAPSRGNAETMAYMNYYWRHGFMPFPPTSHWDLRWYRERVFMFFDMPGGFTLQGLALFIWFAGLATLATRRLRYAAWIVLPLVLTLVASSLKLYPFHGRMTLFLAPVIFLLAGEGVAWLGGGQPLWVRRAVLGSALMLLMAQPAVRAARMVVAPSRHHELEQVLAYADAHWAEGDRVYLRQGDYISYRFLAGRYGFPPDAVLFESRKPGLESDEEQFRGEISPQFEHWGRVWFPMAYDYDGAVAPYVELLDAYGRRFDRFVARGAVVYGIDFGDSALNR
jgi:hypothetical protein